MAIETITIAEAKAWVEHETERQQNLRTAQNNSYDFRADWSKAYKHFFAKNGIDGVAVPSQKIDKKTGAKREELVKLLVYKRKGKIETTYLEFRNTDKNSNNSKIMNGVLNFRDLQGNLEIGLMLQNNNPTATVLNYGDEKAIAVQPKPNGRVQDLCYMYEKCDNWTISIGMPGTPYYTRVSGYSCVPMLGGFCYDRPWFANYPAFDEMLLWFPNEPVIEDENLYIEIIRLLS